MNEPSGSRDRSLDCSTEPRFEVSKPNAAEIARMLPDALYRHHLGIGPGARVDACVLDMMLAGRRWYSEHGNPHLAVVRVPVSVENGSNVKLTDKRTLESPWLATGLRGARQAAVVVGAFSAGGRVDQEIAERWRLGETETSFALAAFAAAVAELLRDRTFHRLRDECAAAGWDLSLHTSPGYHDWDLRENQKLVDLFGTNTSIRVLPSGGLVPQRSTLAACGLRRRSRANQEPTSNPESPQETTQSALPRRALEKWARERLTLEELSDGRLRARFRVDGTTCSNLGRALAIDYSIELGPGEVKTRRIEGLRCRPAAGDSGHLSMCIFIDATETEGPAGESVWNDLPNALGRSVDEAIASLPPHQSAGCLCRPQYRTHKWRVVLETLRLRLQDGKGQRVPGNQLQQICKPGQDQPSS